jgi:uncharacterized membrane protein YhiD involved in acid resistance
MQEFLDLLNNSQQLSEPATPMNILFSLFCAFIFTVPIALTYMKTCRKKNYKQTFIQTLILIAITVASVMLVIGNNIARAFGLIGAVTIIRFRTKVKDPKDTTFLFFSIVVGMSCGLRLYGIGLITTVFICCVQLLLWKIDFGNTKENEN